MSESPEEIAIVGAGQAAASAIMSLRQAGFEGRLRLVGDEPLLPYQRPPLSKAYMKGELREDRLYFKQAAWYEDAGVELVLGTRATGIDLDARRVMLEHGGSLPFDRLLLATGSRPRRLELDGADLDNVFDLRSVSDVERFRPMLVEGRRMVVIGGGYIGLEAAASARQMELDVTVLEYAPRVLSRVTGERMSGFFERVHAERGVHIRTNARVVRFEGASGRVTAVTLDTGESIEADLVLIGIGILPNSELAAAAGADCGDGIRVDRDAQSSIPGVFAAGDCTHRPLVHYDRTGRLESVHNAIEQGKLAAAAMLGRPRPAEDCPWFWSDQFDLKLQIAGLSQGFDEEVVRGDPAAEKFATFYLRAGRLLAVDAVNSPQEFMLSKQLIKAGASPDRQLLADAGRPFKEVVAACG